MRRIILAVLLAVVFAVSIFAVVHRRDSSEGSGNGTPTPTATTVLPEGCEPGSNEWALDESLHGADGKILNSGLPAETEAAVTVIKNAARQDPFVLHQLLLDYGVSGVPSVEELRCLKARQEWWLRLDGILAASRKNMVTMRQVLGLPEDVQGNVTVSNTAVVNGNVTVVNSTANVGENVLAVTPPGAKTVYHRTFCANMVLPPGEEVMPSTPTPSVGSTPTPPATNTPCPTRTPVVPPTATPPPPVPTPPQTAAPTPTKVPPCLNCETPNPPEPTPPSWPATATPRDPHSEPTVEIPVGNPTPKPTKNPTPMS